MQLRRLTTPERTTVADATEIDPTGPPPWPPPDTAQRSKTPRFPGPDGPSTGFEVTWFMV